ncbi:DegT/DnrJ/EryC1/StrS family aminotransferase [Streptosporangium sp. NBC_01756]|uniref:DegT/DnrJ/EryC1/StrS family aminotransferase n=1 Tax=Streptosporangium sp. NBC_01756 TaxID=2975950 RepID=UPI002DD896A4|nr:DegT/DnrJ/EryC1/StrS family aminotransferase [Streptosporangium sp. NBC_01756]WSC88435.1 DegT/DnrJ/EryC1/StrS family aminotransferase [Streptosporangium sp. NBC_01756]
MSSTLESIMRDRVGAPCLHVPSARFGLYLALRHWFGAGDRVLISPTNCETVLFIALAAGLRPVMAPVSPLDGNIDLPRVDWSGLSGVLTTHLYGQPDRVAGLRAECDRRGLTLIDDAAHAMLTTVDGRPAGTFGTAGVFSLAKHGRAMSGGFLVVADPAALPELVKRRDELLLDGGARGQILGTLRPMLRETIYRTGLVGPMWRALRALGVIEWTGHRCAPREDELRTAVEPPAELAALDYWLKIDLDDWRMRQGPLLERYLRSRFRVIDRERERRLAGVELLRGTPWAARGVREAPPQPLLRVPLMVEDRDEVITRLERHGVVPGFVYDPPLDDYLDFVPAGPTPEIARWWTSHVLPVDPLRAKRVATLLTRLEVRTAVEPGPEA